MRNENPVIVYGTYDLLLDDHEEIYAFTRTLDNDRLLVILNVSRNSSVFNLPEKISYSNTELLISNYTVDSNENISQIALRPFEARVYRLIE